MSETPADRATAAINTFADMEGDLKRFAQHLEHEFAAAVADAEKQVRLKDGEIAGMVAAINGMEEQVADVENDVVERCAKVAREYKKSVPTVNSYGELSGSENCDCGSSIAHKIEAGPKKGKTT